MSDKNNPMKKSALIRFKLYFLIAGCAVLLVALNGCVAVIPLAALAAGGVGIAKMDSKSNAKITFDSPSIEDTNALLSIQSLAIWPEKQNGLISDVSLAEQLSNAFRIATPMNVIAILQSNSLPQTVEEMTSDERLRLFKTVSDGTEADAVFIVSSSNTKSSYGNIGSAVGIQSASSTESLTFLIYSRQKNDVIWQDTMNVTSDLTMKPAGAAEVQNKCTAQLVKRILDATGKNTSAVSNPSSTKSAL
jgi:hypothetical protein